MVSSSRVVLCVDVGTVRVGCAWGDSEVKIAFPVAVWERAQGRAEAALLHEITSRNAATLVVGLPLGPDGEETPTCGSIRNFVRRLSKRNPIQIEYIDESFSSDEATSRLQAAGTAVGEIDAHAACLILERYFAGL